MEKLERRNGVQIYLVHINPDGTRRVGAWRRSAESPSAHEGKDFVEWDETIPETDNVSQTISVHT